MGFLGQKAEIDFCEPMYSYESGCLLGVKPLACDLESTAVDRAWLSRLRFPEIQLVYSHFGQTHSDDGTILANLGK